MVQLRQVFKQFRDPAARMQLRYIFFLVLLPVKGTKSSYEYKAICRGLR
jgi:hypothetical protein